MFEAELFQSSQLIFFPKLHTKITITGFVGYIKLPRISAATGFPQTFVSTYRKKLVILIREQRNTQ
jgi:hypothetical protein